jgi:hypothetical protein
MDKIMRYDNCPVQRLLRKSDLTPSEIPDPNIALRYRMVTKQGDIIYINDISFSHKKQDGNMYGFSIIADITDSIQFHSAYSMFNLPSSVLPFGYIQCTCEKYPKVLCINEEMLTFLGVSSKSKEWNEFLHDNIFFLLPFEERDTFREYLEAALESKEPIKIKHKIIRQDGSRVTLTGWLGTIINPSGKKEYSIVYTDRVEPKTSVNNSYFRALESAYNIIFEINLSLKTVECIYGKNTSDLGKLYDIRMTLDSAMQFWIDNYIVEEDREQMKAYFTAITTPGKVLHANRPFQTEFRILWDDNAIYSFIGVAIQLDPNSILFCCRDTAKVQFSSLQAREILAAKKLHAYLDEYFADSYHALGTIILEEQGNDMFNLIYASEDTQKFLGWRYDQYLHFIENGLSLEELEASTKKHGIDNDNISKILKGDKISYSDQDGNKYTIQSHISYRNVHEVFMFPEETIPAVNIPQDCIFARTFGHFDIFIDGKLMVFSNSKEKELLALLIDRNGGSMSSSEAISYLWEDEYPDEKVKTRFRKLAMGLKRTLTQNHIEHILINHNGIRSVDTQAFTCDYYELLAGNEQYIKSFHNSYMEDYSWSEKTLGTLWDYS